ncbi:ubiquinol-cytochrome c reductase iron-sulfur subunit [Hymenobacter caeli]|uniref:Cytochrome b6-f complex iron-sulfur subunit n=1 Tax=Hymenobacter caeli TaxID=2735894 RepID=A0ABX2FMP1_9BACT|nr:Rieske (2Fe-2S) protein [Hymenobacter caeli]NRT18406.1 cytochrome b6-f complex iron-sulfur subunit [Hymenobacter caeli]
MATISEMNRKDFLQLFGLGAASLLASACLGGCNAATGSDSAAVPAAPANVNLTVDLTATTSTPLNDAAVGYIYADSRAIIVAKTTAGTYLAFQAPCPHQGTSVYFSPSQSRFICPNHNAIFNLSGAVVSGPVSSGLRQYTVAQSGNILTISS